MIEERWWGTDRSDAEREGTPVPPAERETTDADESSLTQSGSRLRAHPAEEAPDEPGSLAPGTVIADRFRVGRVLGRGGHGSVYQAEHLSLGYPVAVKVLNGGFGLDARRRARFRREALLGARLRHRNVVSILDAGELEDGAPFLVMEHVDGVDLETLTDKAPLDAAATVEIGVQLLAALTALGERGVIHRDIKPSNVMLQRCIDGFVEVKLLDFGISKALRGEIALETLTADDCVLGTPQYMPPEQVRGEALDVRADLYSVGCVLYQCLTGDPPFDAETPGSVLARVLTERARPVREVRSDVPPAIAAVVDRALSRAREDRWRNACEMSEALRAAAQMLALPRGADAWGGIDRKTAAARPGTMPIALVRPRAGASAQPVKPSTAAEVRRRSAEGREPTDRSGVASVETALPMAFALPFGTLSRRAWRRIAVGAIALPTALGIAAATWHGDGGTSAPIVIPGSRDAASNVEPKQVVPVIAAQPPSEASALPIALANTEGAAEAIMAAPVERPEVEPETRGAPVARRGVSSSPELLERRALAAFVAGREREAIGVYQRVTEVYPERASAWRGLGLAADAMGERHLAARALRRYLDLAPDARDREVIERRVRSLGGS